MKKIFTKEVKIGLCVIVALAILFFGIDFLKGVNVFKAANYYYASYTNVEGLAVSAPVNLNGFKVGLVRSIQYEYDNPGHVLVELSLDRELRVPVGSKAVIGSDILGTASVQLQLADTNVYYSVGDKIEAANAKGMLDAIGGDLMPTVNQILPRIDELLANINTLVGDSALLASVKRLDAITAQLETTTRNLALASAQLSPIATDVKQITGNVTTISSDLAGLTTKLQDAPIDNMMRELETTAANLRQLSEQLNDPSSSLGLLMHDPALYDNINSTVKSLDELLIDIQKNPKRYISIKVF